MAAPQARPFAFQRLRKRPSPFTPVVFYRDPTAALKWLEQAFGFETSLLVIDDAGRVGHAGLVEEVHPDFDARVRVYMLRPDAMQALKSWLEETEQPWAEQVAAFKAHRGQGAE